jgi:hypothetical protein
MWLKQVAVEMEPIFEWVGLPLPEVTVRLAESIPMGNSGAIKFEGGDYLLWINPKLTGSFLAAETVVAGLVYCGVGLDFHRVKEDAKKIGITNMWGTPSHRCGEKLHKYLQNLVIKIGSYPGPYVDPGYGTDPEAYRA